MENITHHINKRHADIKSMVDDCFADLIDNGYTITFELTDRQGRHREFSGWMHSNTVFDRSNRNGIIRIQKVDHTTGHLTFIDIEEIVKPLSFAASYIQDDGDIDFISIGIGGGSMKDFVIDKHMYDTSMLYRVSTQDMGPFSPFWKKGDSWVRCLYVAISNNNMMAISPYTNYGSDINRIMDGKKPILPIGIVEISIHDIKMHHLLYFREQEMKKIHLEQERERQRELNNRTWFQKLIGKFKRNEY